MPGENESPVKANTGLDDSGLSPWLRLVAGAEGEQFIVDKETLEKDYVLD